MISQKEPNRTIEQKLRDWYEYYQDTPHLKEWAETNGYEYEVVRGIWRRLRERGVLRDIEANLTQRRKAAIFEEFGIDVNALKEQSDLAVETDSGTQSEEFVQSTLDKFIQENGIDPKKYRVKNFKISNWGGVNDTKQSINAEFSNTIDDEDSSDNYSLEEIGHLFRSVVDQVGVQHSKPLELSGDPQDEEPHLLLISLCDLHLDKLTHVPETIESQADRAKTAVQYLLKKAQRQAPIEAVCLVLGHDFFHTNGPTNATEKGTPMQVSADWRTSFKAGLQLCIELVELCRAVSKQTMVVTVPGNHGPSREFYNSIALNAYYRTAEDVTIDTDSDTRRYICYGNTSMMLNHEFEKSDLRRLPLLFIREQPYMFADTKYHYILTGHLHKREDTVIRLTTEDLGVVYKVLPGLSGTDTWHFDSTYVGNNRSCVGLMISRSGGQNGEYIYNC